MTADKKNSKEPLEQQLSHSDEEATQANKEIQEAFYSDEKTGPSASPIPFVANNTAPLSTADDKKKKQ